MPYVKDARVQKTLKYERHKSESTFLCQIIENITPIF
jgi:hypothetical protein